MTSELDPQARELIGLALQVSAACRATASECDVACWQRW
jgi:hypothetical protein